MDSAIDTFDFARTSDETIPTPASALTKNQYSDHSVLRPGGAHWRCEHCVESVIYSLANGHVEHVRMWTCCQCGFAENRVSLWAACSMCNMTNFLDIYAFQYPSISQLGIDNTTDDEVTAETPHVICADVPATENSVGTFATDDLGSVVRQNLALFDSLLDGERVDFGVPPNNIKWCDLGVDTTEVCLENQPNLQIPPTIDQPFIANLRNEVEVLTGFPSEESASTAPTTKTNLTPSTLTTKTLQDLDSGYGSQCASKADHSSRKRSSDYDHQTLSTTSISHSSPNPPPTKKPRRRRLDPLNPGLACPFYIRNPARCEHDSCASPRFLGIHRLKQHLERVHLYHTCPRCGAPFSGDTVGRERLAAHQRQLQPCQLLTKPRVETWGISHSTFEAIRTKRGGAVKKPDEERWRDIYRLIFPGAAEEEMATPYVDAEHARRGFGEQHGVAAQDDHAVDSFSRQLLSILPARLVSAIEACCCSETASLRGVWNEFLRNEIHDVLRDALVDIANDGRECTTTIEEEEEEARYNTIESIDIKA